MYEQKRKNRKNSYKSINIFFTLIVSNNSYF